MDIEINQQNQEDQQRVAIFKALADDNRLRIIRVLYQAQREMTCGEVGAQLSISKSTVSYHFKALRLVGLTNTRREAQTKYLSLQRATFDHFLPGFLDSL
ncbi:MULTISPECIES: ArsR/SmtB family transcription factor [Lactiplantibacillus]|uniref:Metalloregulator ArsR/SmtB family transcription factor n=1 Tax=Lactiplantibacillus pentosus TaxID=1589 RepID=A0AAW8W805_LACPE|nr:MULTISPECIES: metalloregulator ArsR/SmtB family transcription factor [Lactiplantibacillus]AUI77290.1 transcriptional regulator [Lactiplantibacillus pentosus]MBU7462052.1 helix-turn-helix transcriptional regulator [Lactiplantibacillus pentosus]MBU7476586.1 helix-turn-helix transcriptional regulator [Lactiplantibacillus pentosus]MBU7483214.1 helix-turn-helix transcriptional regulator [Lactiplantibacillus sp. 30.2.29]MBU7486664.1 helix-turn-helix transcriptional regulator [Lactiplantibacillus 